MSVQNEAMQEPEKDQLRLILVVEDDIDLGNVLVETIKQETTYHALLATNSADALRITKHLQCHLFLLDYHLPGINGIALFDQLSSAVAPNDIKAILMTASTQVSPQELEKRPQIVFMSKPTDIDLLISAINNFMSET